LSSHRALKAQPNAAHIALATFSLPSLRHIVVPGSTFTLITQNVDYLSARALEQVQSSSVTSFPHSSTPGNQPTLLEMHGRLFDVQCTSLSCGHTEFNTTSPICESLHGTEKLFVVGDPGPEIPLSLLPRCSKCNALARPGVVWFGEIPKHTEVISDLVDKADLCLVVGTSSTASRIDMLAPRPLTFPSRYIPLQDMRRGSKTLVVKLQCLISTAAKGTKKRIFFSWEHARKIYQKH
jgi:NAD+-dependent protein deacetylase sirtuin 5